MSEEIDDRFATRRILNAENKAEKLKERIRLDSIASTLHITLEDYKYALRKFEANYTKVANFLGIDRDVVARKVLVNPSLKRLVKSIWEERKDVVEEKLYDTARSGNVTAITFFLKTKAKDRGYVERNTVEVDEDILATSAAALITAMRKGANKQLEDKDADVIEVTDYTWEEEKQEKQEK